MARDPRRALRGLWLARRTVGWSLANPANSRVQWAFLDGLGPGHARIARALALSASRERRASRSDKQRRDQRNAD
jgi:hypothetical protein